MPIIPSVIAILVEIGAIVYLMQFANQHHTRWLTGVCAFLLSLGAACSIGAAAEVLILNIYGFASASDLAIACGWAVIAFIGFTLAKRFARSRWLVVIPICVVGTIFAAYGLILL
jgi:hypothetical protein